MKVVIIVSIIQLLLYYVADRLKIKDGRVIVLGLTILIYFIAAGTIEHDEHIGKLPSFFTFIFSFIPTSIIHLIYGVIRQSKT